MSEDPDHEATPQAADDGLLRLVLDSAADFGILAADQRGIVTVWNAGAERLFGYREAEILGVGIDVIFTPEDRAMGVPEMEKRRALTAGRAEDERWHIRRDGSRFWGSGLLMPLAGPAGGFVKVVRDRTARRVADETLRESEAAFRTMTVGMPQLVFRSFATGERSWSGPQWQQHTGLSDRASTGFGWLEAVHPDDRAATLDGWAGAKSMDGYLVEHRIRHAADGGYRWHQTRAVPPLDGPGGTGEWIGGSADVHGMHELKERLAHTEWRLRTLVEGMPQLVWRSNDMGHWTWCSPQWQGYTGQDRAASLDRGWLLAIHPDDRDATIAAWTEARSHGMLDVEFRVHRLGDDAYVWHRTRSMPVHDAAGRIVEWIGTTTDIEDLKELQRRQQVLLTELQRHARTLETEMDERKGVEAQLLYTAYHDDLTRLYNRAFFMNRLRQALDQRDRVPGFRCAVLFMDLDRFKLVNDSLGHQAGNLLLMEAAQRLQSCSRPQDTLARVGGDEFALLAEGFDHVAEVEAIAERIITALRQPFWVGTQQVFSSCSVGVVEAGDRNDRPDEVLRDADIAMYHAKRRSAGSYTIFVQGMRDSAVSTMELQTALQTAIARGEFHLHYQPICRSATAEIVGLEALVRWRHPVRGVVPPDEFIPVAEETGLIRDIGRWVLRTACTQMRRWRERYPDLDLHVNVNASGSELTDRSFTADLRHLLDETGLEPAALQLEVTEAVFLERPDVAGEVLGGVRGLGVRVALDDFGTGYSSLGYLSRYRMDAIKIDRSFVGQMLSDAGTAAVVEAIVRMGQALRLDVVAEGVEDEAQLRALAATGCTHVQGYLLGRPMPPEEVEAALAGPRHRVRS